MSTDASGRPWVAKSTCKLSISLTNLEGGLFAELILDLHVIYT